MSLINDALKRASQAKPPPAAPPETPLYPAEPRRSRLPLFVVPVVIFLVCGLAGWFFFKAWQTRIASRLPINTTPVVAREAPNSSQSLPLLVEPGLANSEQISRRKVAGTSAPPSTIAAKTNLPSA